ncbi:hypothetical protein O7632_29380 [Solwaraspora sp. WMMD406]|uniref:hypothetical protein n=1 Tax=Solwaraspora sp. WMMD406 TaxID=3016095 RepID=UPI002416CEA1|nr:hypothetical protein [Solwaraspora sp. WMMD406]MDG4768169.1 hypothetical protein [Solwaraspora sp. WMMD406]
MTDRQQAPMRRGWSIWPLVGIIATVFCCAAPVAGAVVLVDRLPSPDRPVPHPTGHVVTAPPASPRPGDPIDATEAWLRSQLGTLLEQQAAALLAGDERTFLAVVGPEPQARADLARQYRTLRAMRVTAWRPAISTLAAIDPNAGLTAPSTVRPGGQPTATPTGPTTAPPGVGPSGTPTTGPSGAPTSLVTAPPAAPPAAPRAPIGSPDPAPGTPAVPPGTDPPSATVGPSVTPSTPNPSSPPAADGVPTVPGSPTGAPPTAIPTQWRLLVSYQHCFVVPSCTTSPVVVGQRWSTEGGRLRLVAVEPSLTLQDGPRPWEISELVVATGNRTLVATTPAYRDLLPELLRDAEQAAVVADRYAVTGTTPDRYRIFYAGADEWQAWYGGQRPEWTAGYAVAVGGGHYEVVLNGTNLRDALRPGLLRHELTHAASLPDGGHRDRSAWWLIEGLAEHAAAGGRPVVRYEGLDNVRRLVLQQDWQGPLDSAEPAVAAEDWQVSAGYGVGYLAVRHLVDRFGEERVLAFFRAVVHDDASLDTAARAEFAADWDELHQACVDYVRQAAG